MAKNDLSNEALREQLWKDLSEAATLLLSIRDLCADEPDDRAYVVEALAQKAGWLADRAIEALGHGQVVGSWDDWAKP